MIILALDTALCTGWAVSTPVGGIESGIMRLELRRGESYGMRWIRFRAWLTEMLTLTQPDLVVYEQSHHRGGAATEIGVGLTTRVAECCAERGVEYTACHTAVLKRWATGKGNASKDEMIAAARIQWPGWTPQTDDEADARLLLVWAHTTLT